MTKDTYLAIVKKTLESDPSIKIQTSHASKLAALGREVEQRQITPQETIPAIEKMFDPFIGRSMRQALERALR